METPIFVECRCCEGYGNVVTGMEYCGYYDPPSPIEDPCPECYGTGRELIEGEPIELEDTF